MCPNSSKQWQQELIYLYRLTKHRPRRRSPRHNRLYREVHLRWTYMCSGSRSPRFMSLTFLWLDVVPRVWRCTQKRMLDSEAAGSNVPVAPERFTSGQGGPRWGSLSECRPTVSVQWRGRALAVLSGGCVFLSRKSMMYLFFILLWYCVYLTEYNTWDDSHWQLHGFTCPPTCSFQSGSGHGWCHHSPVGPEASNLLAGFGLSKDTQFGFIVDSKLLVGVSVNGFHVSSPEMVWRAC